MIIYVVGIVVMLLIGLIATIVVITEEYAEGTEAFCIFCAGTFVSIIAAALWPLLIASIIPACFAYGAVVLFKVLKDKNHDFNY